MNKTTFIYEIRYPLKERNFCKKGNYWYKYVDSHICCINVQGSQWDSDNYYVNVGFAFPPQKTPTLLQWFCRHRCIGAAGEVNIQPKELYECVDYIFNNIYNTEQILFLLKEKNAVKIGSQYLF